MKKYCGKTAHELARLRVGDGKKPNLFFVSISNDFSYCHKIGGIFHLDGIENIIPTFKPIGYTSEVFKTYDEAKDFADELFATNQKDKDGKEFIVNRVTIEDRCCGEVYEMIKCFNPTDVTVHTSENESYYRFHKETA
jgi:hypothetical protein